MPHAKTLSPIALDNFETVTLSEHASTLLGIAAGKAKNLFGQLLERALVTPVVVTKNDRPTAIVMSPARYLELLREHDELMTLRALEVERTQGYIGEDAAAALIAEIEQKAV